VIVSEYVPLIAIVAFRITGFCALLVNEFGPVHEYVPVDEGPVRKIVSLTHTGEFEFSVGTTGVALITTTVVPAAEVHPFTVTVTLYVPAMARVAPVIEGF
jgi:hypothetical protein